MSAPTFTWHIDNINSWGKNAATSAGYTFDDLYFQKSDSVSAGFDASSGGFGFEAGISASYDVEFGIKSDLTINSGTLSADYAFSAHATGATADQVINTAPFVVTFGQNAGLSQILTQGGDANAFDLILAALVDANVSASIGVSFPLLGSASTDIPIVDVHGGGKIDAVHLAQDGLNYFNANNNYGINLSANIPQGLQGDGSTSNYGSFTESAENPFLTGSVDLDALLAHFGVPTEFIGGSIGFDVEIASLSLGWTIFDAYLNAGASIAETHTLRPDVIATMHSTNLQVVDEPLSRAEDLQHMAAFGETVSGQLGDTLHFTTPEGEGTFQADITYDAFVHIDSVFGIKIGADFEYKLFGGSISGSIVGYSASTDWALVDNTIPLASTIIPIITETDTYSLGEQYDSVNVAFEKFRTADGSGDNFHLTTHQTYAPGNDDPNIILGNDNGDTIDGFGGDDQLTGGAGNDTLRGGDGVDQLLAFGGDNNLSGGGGNDIMIATAGNNTMDGGDGDDQMTAGAGNDSMAGGAGNDVMLAGEGGNGMDGGDGDDRMTAGAGSDTMSGGAGNDLMLAGEGNNSMDGGDGNDQMTAGAGNDTMSGGAGNDVMLAGDGNNTLDGGDGNDRIVSGSGSDVVTGGAGNDTIITGDGDDTVHAGDGNDTITAGTGFDFLYGDGGNDIITQVHGQDTVSETGITPIIDGGDGDDIVYGAAGFHSPIIQLGGLAIVAGGNGADRIISGTADEQLVGGPSDALESGSVENDSDTFVFTPGCGHDDIWDINSLERSYYITDNLRDVIDISAFTNIHSFADVTIRQEAAGRMRIDLTSHDSITFDGVFNSLDFNEIVMNARFIFAGGDPSTIVGTSNNDFLYGGPLGETIKGGGGDDMIDGGSGSDKLFGGAGADEFVIDSAAYSAALQVNPTFAEIVDYNQGGGHYVINESDYIDISATILGFFDLSHASSYVRAVTTPGNAHLLLQVDPTGPLDGQQWTTIATLDNVLASHGVNLQLTPNTNLGDGSLIFPGEQTALSISSNDGHYGDFDGDGKADLVWRSDDGTVATWKMNGGSVSAGNFLTGVSADWHIVGTGDFNGDGKSDIIWQNDNGSLLDWQMTSSSQIGSAFGLGDAPAGSDLAGIGDVDHDGKSDLIWRDTTTGAVTINTMAGATNTINGVGNDWSVVGVGDYNGDGHADIMFRNASQGVNAAWLMNGTNLAGSVFYPGVPNDWHVSGTGDFNGDGTADLLWHNDNGANAVWLMDHSGNIQSSGFFDGVSSDWHPVGTGDFNGDGRDDVVWHSDSGATAIWLMNGANTPTVAFPGGAPSNWMTNDHHYDYV
jgi:Ca2+-binding RTX toxin-like protein